MEDMEQKNLYNGRSRTETQLRNQKRNRRLRWIIFAVVMVVIIAFAVQVFIVLMPRMRTQVVVMEHMTESISVQGFVSLKMEPIESAEGYLYYEVPSGQRVSAGTEVAMVFDNESGVEKRVQLEAVEEELTLLEEAQNTHVDGTDIEVLLGQMDDGLHDYLKVLEDGNYSDLDAAREEITLASNKIHTVTGDEVDYTAHAAKLEQQKNSLSTEAVAKGQLTAPQTGYFVSSPKNDRVSIDHKTLAKASPNKLQKLMEKTPEYYSESVAGHIVSDYNWQFFTVVDQKQGEKFYEGMKLELMFPDISEDTMPVKVEKLTESKDGEQVKIELNCENINADILSLRLENAQLVFSITKGLRIDKNAMRIIDGEKCVYVKFGNQVYQRRIKVLLEDDNYLLLPEEYEEGVNEVQLYDEIVVDAGGVELYDKKIL